MVSKDQMEAAIRRVAGQSNSEIRRVRENAVRLGAQELVDACDAELQLRGSVVWDASQAARAREQADRVAGWSLEKVIHAAFTDLPARDEELALLRVIQANPGAQFGQIEEAFGRRDTALIAGHLVYERLGFFRQFLEEEDDQSSILLIKERVAGRITWRLKPETERVLCELGVFPS
jgi:hypothetical protein